MSRWFRFYTEALNDPKVQSLPAELFKIWVNLLCVASQNNGQLPSSSDLAILLRRRCDYVDGYLSELAKRGLIDTVDDHLEPHKWSERQYKSDTSNERVKRYREAKCNVTNTVTVTPPDYRLQTTDKKEEDIRAVAKATRPDVEKDFQEFWNEYPRRDGANPRKPAFKVFSAAVRSGHSPEVISAGAKRYASELSAKGQIGTPYVAQAVTWLRQSRWEDYATDPPSTTGGWVEGLPTSEELRAKYARERADKLGTEERVEERQSVVATGLPTREDNQGVVPRPQGFGGTRSLGKILSEARLFPMGIQEGGGLDGPMSVAGMADD